MMGFECSRSQQSTTMLYVKCLSPNDENKNEDNNKEREQKSIGQKIPNTSNTTTQYSTFKNDKPTLTERSYPGIPIALLYYANHTSILISTIRRIHYISYGYST